MENVFLAAPSEQYRAGFLALVEDYRTNGEKKYFESYREACDDFPAYVQKLTDHAEGKNLPEGWVPSNTFWLVNASGDVLGNIRIRHTLGSEWLKNIAGNIGYDVAPSFRRRGYGIAMLRLGLEKARGLGLADAMISCEKSNEGSRRIIEACGGIFERLSTDKDGAVYRIYQIPVAR